MSTNFVSHLPLSGNEITNPAIIDKIIDRFYINLLDDYRINRFFYPRPIEQQSEALKAFVKIAINPKSTKEEFYNGLEHYFSVAFARTNAKPSNVSGRDFAFLLDIVGGQEIRTITLLCPAHGHLMKLDPHDDNYDVAIELLDKSLKELQISDDLSAKVIALAEKARNGLMGRGEEILQAA